MSHSLNFYTLGSYVHNPQLGITNVIPQACPFPLVTWGIPVVFLFLTQLGKLGNNIASFTLTAKRNLHPLFQNYSQFQATPIIFYFIPK